jgi:hypothetical protein
MNLSTLHFVGLLSSFRTSTDLEGEFLNLLQDAGKNGVKAEETQEEEKQAGKGTKRKANGRKTGGAAGRV